MCTKQKKNTQCTSAELRKYNNRFSSRQEEIHTMFVSLKGLLCIKSPGRNLMGENPGLFKLHTSEEWQYARILSFSILWSLLAFSDLLICSISPSRASRFCFWVGKCFPKVRVVLCERSLKPDCWGLCLFLRVLCHVSVGLCLLQVCHHRAYLPFH